MCKLLLREKIKAEITDMVTMTLTLSERPHSGSKLAQNE